MLNFFSGNHFYDTFSFQVPIFETPLSFPILYFPGNYGFRSQLQEFLEIFDLKFDLTSLEDGTYHKVITS